MRPLRPPPRVTPPKPPAHLFEPREDIGLPVRLDTQLKAAKPQFDFEGDVKFQMQQLENEMKLMLAKETANVGSGPAAANQFAHADHDSRSSYEPTSHNTSIGRPNMPSGSNPFDSRVNPNDWKAKGFPSEFAYMKAMGLLEIGSNKPSAPSKLNVQPSHPAAPPEVRDTRVPAAQTGPPMQGQDHSDGHYEREMISPARRKGGAIQNLYVEEEDLRRKFASQHSYSDQLQKQADEQRRAREFEKEEHRGVGHRGPAQAANTGMRFPSEQRLAVQQQAPVPSQSQVPSRMTGGAPSNPPASDPYNPEFDRYRSSAPLRAEPVSRMPDGGTQGNRPPAAYEPGNNKYVSPSPNERLQGRFTEPNSYPESNDYTSSASRRQDQGPTQRHDQGPAPSHYGKEANTGLLLGLDKQSEKALKRAKQDEYRRQLDQTKPKQEQIPAIQSAVVDSNQYLYTGTRPAPAAAAPRVMAQAPSSSAQRASSAAHYRDDAPQYDRRGDSYAPQASMGRHEVPPSYPPQRHGPPVQVASHNQGPYGYPPEHREVEDYSPSFSYRGAPAAIDPRMMAEPAHPPRREDYSQQYRNVPVASGRERDWEDGNAAQDYSNRALQQGQRADYARAPSVDRRQAQQGAPSYEAAVSAEKENAKEAKKRQQEEYRRELERQMEAKQALKVSQKKEEEQRDAKFLQYIAAAEGGDTSNQRRKKGQGPPQQPHPAAPPAAVQQAGRGGGYDVLEKERNGPPRGAAAAAQYQDDEDRHAENVAREYELMKAQMAQMERGGKPRPRAELFEADSEERSDYRAGGRDGPPHREERRDPAEEAWMLERMRNERAQRRPEDLEDRGAPDDRGDYGYRGHAGAGGDAGRGGGGNSRHLRVDIDADDAPQPVVSPFKSPNEARTRFMKDIYGGKSLISHVEQAPAPGEEAAGQVKWKPSMGDVDIERRRKALADNKAELDKQVEATKARKEQERAEEEDRERKKEERDRELQARRDDALAAEKKKKDDINNKNAKDFADLQERKEREALARRGKGTNRLQDGEPEPAPKVAPARDQRGAERSERVERAERPDQRAEPSPRGRDYDHIKSPMRDMLQQQQQYNQQIQAMMASQASQGPGGSGLNMYDSPSPDMVDSFVRNFGQQQQGYDPRDEGMPPQHHQHQQARNAWNRPPAGYPPQQPAYMPSPYASYSNQPPPGYYPQHPHPPPQGMQGPPSQYPPQLYPQRGTFYPNEVEKSIVSDSRLIPANIWSSSDMLSSLVPVGASATAARVAAGASVHARDRQEVDLERSIASDSALVYLGSRTPALASERSNRANLHTPSRGQEARVPSARPIISPATAQLSDLIADTNRMIEQESAQLHVQKRDVAPAPPRRHSPQVTAEGGTRNRISPTHHKPHHESHNEPYNEPVVEENDGISTAMYRSDSQRSKYIEGIHGVLEDIPPAKNRIFLSQKIKYEDPEDGNQVMGYNDNMARSVTLLDSADSVQLRPVVAGAHIATQTSERNLMANKSAQVSAQVSPRSATESPRREKARRSSTSVLEDASTKTHRGGMKKESPRKESPRFAEEESTCGEGAVTAAAFGTAVALGSGHKVGRSNVADVNTNLMKTSGDHRSPRQRAMDNKLARGYGAGGSANTSPRVNDDDDDHHHHKHQHKLAPVDAEPVAEQPNSSPRPRRNVLGANENLLSAPVDRRSPRQRALDRKEGHSPRRDSKGDKAPSQNMSPRAAVEPEYSPQVRHEPGYDARFDEWPAEAAGAEKVADEVADEGAEDQLYANPYMEDNGAWERNNGQVEEEVSIEDGLYSNPYAEDNGAWEAQEPVDPTDYPADFPTEYPTDYPTEYAAEAQPDECNQEQDYTAADAPAEDIVQGQEQGYDYPQPDGNYYGGEGAVDGYGYGVADADAGYYAEQAAEPAEYGEQPAEPADYTDVQETGNVAYEEALPSARSAAEKSPRRNVLGAASSILKPGGDHRSPRQRALDNKAAREAGGSANVSPRVNVPPFAVDGAVDDETPKDAEHVRQRKNLLDANEGILKPATVGGAYRSPRDRAQQLRSDRDASAPNSARGVDAESSKPLSRPVSSRPRSAVLKAEASSYGASIEDGSRPASGRPKSGRSRAISNDYSDYVVESAMDMYGRPASSGTAREDGEYVVESAMDMYGQAYTDEPEEFVIESAMDMYAAPSSRPPSSRPHSGAANLPRQDSAGAELPPRSRPASGRPRTGRSAVREEPVADAVAHVAEPLTRSRPATGTGRPSSSHTNKVYELTTDALDSAVHVDASREFSPVPSRPASGHPRSTQGRRSNADAAPDVLDNAVADSTAAAVRSRPTTGRSQHAQYGQPEGTVDALDHELTSSRVDYAGSRPATDGAAVTASRPQSSKQMLDWSSDVLDRALEEQDPQGSRPQTGKSAGRR